MCTGQVVSAAWTNAGTLIADGKSLEYACYGPPPANQPTLVLLHEGLGCTQLWRDFPAALSNATGLGVFAYSRAGYGHSDPVSLPRPLDYMTREAADVLPEVLDAIGAQRTILLGHSDGATIAAIYAGCIADPDVMGVVLIAPHFFTEAIGLKAIANARNAYDSGDLRVRLSRYHNNPDTAFRGWNDSWLHPDFKAWNVAKVLEYIRVPVCAIQGREDPYGTLAQIEAITNGVKHAPVSTLILDNCKHAPQLEQGPATITAIAEFCATLAPQQATP